MDKTELINLLKESFNNTKTNRNNYEDIIFDNCVAYYIQKDVDSIIDLVEKEGEYIENICTHNGYCMDDVGEVNITTHTVLLKRDVGVELICQFKPGCKYKIHTTSSGRNVLITGPVCNQYVATKAITFRIINIDGKNLLARIYPGYPDVLKGKETIDGLKDGDEISREELINRGFRTVDIAI